MSTGAEFDKGLSVPTGHQHSGPKAETQWNKSECHQVRNYSLNPKGTMFQGIKFKYWY